ncbi:MAG: hypothetical protein ABIR32_17980 [Ilumatobacteraceae bacterium]
MSNDPQDWAEDTDDEMIGGDDPVTSDEVKVDFPPDSPVGIPFADADVTDESFAERSLQEEPEVNEDNIDLADADDINLLNRNVDVEALVDPDTDI